MTPTVADDAPEVYDDDETVVEVEYGYMQIDDYRSYKMCDVRPKKKRWVPLAQGTHVETYHNSSSKQNRDVSQRSYSFDREATTSTMASSKDLCQVHFRDGTLPGCQEEQIVGVDSSMHELKTSVADWIFIDRDICGFSLHEYDPESQYDPDSVTGGFASSPYGQTFREELDDIVNMNLFRQQMTALCAEPSESCTHEERQVDKALLLAGVHVNYIHATPEELQQPRIEEIVLSL